MLVQIKLAGGYIGHRLQQGGSILPAHQALKGGYFVFVWIVLN